MANRRWVEVEQPDKHFADDATTDRTKAIAAESNVSFAENVVPQWSVPGPPRLRCPDLIASQRLLTKQPRDSFARGKPDTLAALEVTPDLFERIIDGAMADHCHKTNPRIATRDDYRAMLEASM